MSYYISDTMSICSDPYPLLKNIFASGELDEKVVVAKIATTTQHGAINGKTQSKDTNFYNLDAIIAVADIRKLERAVSAYFDYIERIIERHQTFTMKEFAASVNKFLEFNEYRVLEGPGKVPRAVADEKAGKEYDIFNKHQPIISDFDQEIKRLLGKDEK